MWLTYDPTEKKHPSPANGSFDPIANCKGKTVANVDAPVVEPYRGTTELRGIVIS